MRSHPIQLAFFVFAFLTLTAIAEQRTLYVAPAGNDAWSGSLASPNAEKSDGPLATVAAARDRVRELRQKLPRPAQITVKLRGGTYLLAEALEFGPADSGDEQLEIVYEAYGDERPVLCGGRRIGAWRAGRVNEREVWMADLPAEIRALPAEQRASVRELFVNGNRCRLARTPNEGFLEVESQPEATGKEWNLGGNLVRYKEADAAAWAGTAGVADLVVMNRWVDTHTPIASVDAAARTATLAAKTFHTLDPGDLYYIEGAAEALDAPGEWRPDFAAGVAYYSPRPGEEMATAVAEIPYLAEIVRLNGDAEHDQPVARLTFRGLVFEHARWWFGPPGGAGWAAPDKRGFAQAAWGVPGALVAHAGQHITFDRCTIAGVSGYGIEFAAACRDNRLTHCTLRDLGAGGVKIGTTALPTSERLRTGGNVVTDCTIENGGLIHHQAIGVWIGQSDANTVAHNHIREFDYSGISIGWTWGYGPSAAHHNIVEFNEVDHLGDRPGNTRPPLGDMGGIYTLGMQPGTTIRNNYFHDIAGRTIAWGIYFDEGSTEVVAEHNLVVGCSHGAFHQHYGRDNHVRNNVFVEGGAAQLWRTRAEPQRSFTLDHNIIYFTHGKLFGNDWSGAGFELDHNLYWSPDAALLRFPGNLTLEQWQAAGHDADSICADPRFVAPGKQDYRLQADSPARALGIRSGDWSQVGPRPGN